MRADELSTSRAFRTSREAFGYSLFSEKANRDWLWFVGSVALVVVIAVVFWYKG